MGTTYFDALGYVPNRTHPGVAVGTELSHRQRARRSMVQPLEVGYFYHQDFSHSTHVDTGILYRGCGASLCGSVGPMLGLERMSYPGTTYRFEDGRYRAQRGNGDLNARIGLAGTVSYRLSDSRGRGVTVFATYRQWALAGFLPGNGLPVFMRTQVGVGIMVPLRSPGSNRAEGRSAETRRAR